MDNTLHEILENLHILKAINLLEYHNKNLLGSGKTVNEEQERIIRNCISSLSQYISILGC